ncbi:EFR1 family ferrodoxin [Chloroflexota bacterium]
MKSIIIYFSQTGNTKKVAEAICDDIKATTGQCDIVKIEEANVREQIGYDLIGLGCPTFVHREPLNVSRFINGMEPLKGKYCFVFSTHGGHPGNVLPSMAGKIRRQGLTVIGGFNCDGSDHYPHYTFPWYTEGHPDDIDLKEAADFGKQMVERSLRSRGEKSLVPAFQWLRTGMYLYEPPPKTVKANKPLSRQFDFEMSFDKEKCRYPRCRLCIDNCPVRAIDLSADPIIFRRGCISCLFCEMLCPTGAINIKTDAKSIEHHRKSLLEYCQRTRYPEFFERAKTELIGNRGTLYRMLVDNVEIGNSDELYGETHRRRPRYIKH